MIAEEFNVSERSFSRLRNKRNEILSRLRLRNKINEILSILTLRNKQTTGFIPFKILYNWKLELGFVLSKMFFQIFDQNRQIN